MTKQEIVTMYYKLDRGKFDLLAKGVAFDFVIRENGAFLHTGIGTGGDMSIMALYSILDLYTHGAQGVTIEDFAESVKRGIIDAYKSGAFISNENV